MQPIARLAIVAAVAVAVIGGLVFELNAYPASSPVAATSTTSLSSLSPSMTPRISSGYCMTPNGRVFAPLPNGPLFLKVTTDQGAIIPNATILVNHTGGTLGSGKLGFASYCLHLRPNASGYAEASANDSLVSFAQYNVTLVSGYYQGDYRSVTLPPLFVPMNSTVYVNIAIPSGKVTEVTCGYTRTCTTTSTTMTNSVTG